MVSNPAVEELITVRLATVEQKAGIRSLTSLLLLSVPIVTVARRVEVWTWEEKLWLIE